MKVNTVRGPIDVEQMGLTLMHEHIVNVELSLARAFPGFYDRESVVEQFCEEMEGLKAYGVKTFVDPTPINLGRDIELMQKCSERTGINIITCTGIYYQEKPFFYFGIDPQVLADYLIQEIEQGIEGTGMKPGFIKCASQLKPGETEINKNMLRAAAIASKATGLPIYTHTQPGSRLGEYQKRIFTEEGVAPEKIAYGHTFNAGGGDYIRALTQDGSYAGCDQLAFAGLGKAASIDELADLLAELFNSGLQDRIFLSCDASIRTDFGCALSKNARDRSSNVLILPNRRKEMLFEGLLPALKARGVSDDIINEVLVMNPRRYFS